MSASPDRMVAGLIGDRYEITGLIASGGMGAVYRARDKVLDRTVAVKVLKNGGDDPEFVAKFKAEATNAARLSHPNIVQVFDFGYENGQPYMAMEFVDGQNLREILSARHVLRPDVAARIALQVASALEHARRNGLMHRDIKPENILITTDGVVKVADFGLSRALAESRATQANVLMGTAAYLAPEQVQGETVDHRADIYSLGIVLFEMLTGKLPFGGDSPVVVAYKRVAEDVPSAMSINPGVPRELDVIVARATGRAASSRFATAGQMVEALREQAPRSDTGDIGGLVHHTQAIPIVGQETIAVQRRGGGAEGPARRSKQKRDLRRPRWLALLLLLSVIAATIYVIAVDCARVQDLDTKPVQRDGHGRKRDLPGAARGGQGGQRIDDHALHLQRTRHGHRPPREAHVVQLRPAATHSGRFQGHEGRCLQRHGEEGPRHRSRPERGRHRPQGNDDHTDRLDRSKSRRGSRRHQEVSGRRDECAGDSRVRRLREANDEREGAEGQRDLAESERGDQTGQWIDGHADR
ncbi:MAG: serine/threonine protein kinase [Actinobacteria bacterium]|nr:MAG: serine/threonine protein kinase [Actinomycetota bacterium]